MASLTGRFDFRVGMRHVEAQAQAGRTASGHLFLPQFASIGAQAAGEKTPPARGSIRVISAIATANKTFSGQAQPLQNRPARLGATVANSPGSTGPYRFSIACTGRQLMFAAKKAAIERG
jgi:hypothetical protein